MSAEFAQRDNPDGPAMALVQLVRPMSEWEGINPERIKTGFIQEALQELKQRVEKRGLQPDDKGWVSLIPNNLALCIEREGSDGPVLQIISRLNVISGHFTFATKDANAEARLRVSSSMAPSDYKPPLKPKGCLWPGRPVLDDSSWKFTVSNDTQLVSDPVMGEIHQALFKDPDLKTPWKNMLRENPERARDCWVDWFLLDVSSQNLQAN